MEATHMFYTFSMFYTVQPIYLFYTVKRDQSENGTRRIVLPSMTS